MRIAIIATGSRGDVEPYLALGKGLKAAGHTIHLVTHDTFAPLVEPHGVELWPVAADVREVAQSESMRALLTKGSFLAVMAEMAKQAERVVHLLAEAGLAAAQGMDALLAGVGGLYIGVSIAESLGLPMIQAHYIPFTPTSAFPSFLAPGMRLGGFANRLSHHAVRQVMWQQLRRADTRAREEVLGIPPAPFAGPYRAKCLQGMPTLYGYSPAVIPPPPDWGADTNVTGYWILDAARDWSPPQDLSDFLEAGPPPVYVGFGSMGDRDPRRTAAIVIEALTQAQQRAILLAGWGGLDPGDLPESIYLLDSAPFAWLFPRCAAVVHHGGAGTTGAGLRAGVPTIVIPFFADQPYWGRRVQELGVGPTPIPRRKLTVERLVQALAAATGDAGMRERAAALGQRIRAEDGIARAVEVIEQIAP